MINASIILEQLAEWLDDDPDLDGFRACRGDFINEDAGQALNGWIGIYRRSITYDPRNLGVPPNNYRAAFVFDVIVQKSNLQSGEDCEDALEEATKVVLDRIVTLPKTYIDHVSDMTVQYSYLETERKTMYFQSATIEVTAQVSIEVE